MSYIYSPLGAKLAAIPVAAGLAAAALPIAVVALPIGFSVVKIRQAMRARRINRSRTSSDRSFDVEIERQLELMRSHMLTPNEFDIVTGPLDLLDTSAIDASGTISQQFRRRRLEFDLATFGVDTMTRRYGREYPHTYLDADGPQLIASAPNVDLFNSLALHERLSAVGAAHRSSQASESEDVWSTNSAPIADDTVSVEATIAATPFDDVRAVVVV